MPLKPIFVLGCPRSGTGLLRDLLRAHPAVAIPHESHFIPALYRAYGDPRDAAEARRIADIVRQRMHWSFAVDDAALQRARTCGAVIGLVYATWARDEGGRRWGDKTPNYVLELPLLREIFPDAKIVHIVRDGRDVALSLLRSHIGPENLPTAARYWRRRVSGGRAAGYAMGPDAYHELRYEDLLDDSEPVLRALCAFIGEPYEPTMVTPDYLETEVRSLIIGTRRHGVVSKTEIVRGNRDKWKTLMKPADRARFEAVAGGLLRDLRYETEGRRRPGGPLTRIGAAAHHRAMYLAYRINTGSKREWLALAAWMWRARARHLLRRARIVGPPLRSGPAPRSAAGSPPTRATGRGVPTPAGLPLVGHVPSLLRDKLGFFSRCARLGDVVALRVGATAYLLNDPQDIAHVLIGNHRNYGKSKRLTSPGGKRLAGDGLLTSTAQGHGPRRRLLRPLFHRRTIGTMASSIVRNTRQTLRGWPESGQVDVEDAMTRLTRRNIVASLFSVDTNDDGAALDAAIVARQRYIEYVFGTLLPLPELWPFPTTLRYRRAMRTLDDFIYRQIDARSAAGGPDDLLGMLLDARYEDGTPMSDDEIRDEVMVMSLTGYETIGVAIAWMLHLLSRHPRVLDRVRRQIARVAGGRELRAEDVERLPLLRAALAESMRLYPPTWIQVRIAVADDMLPSGAYIPAGAKVYLCQWVTHRTARHFDDPDRFDPERFLGSDPQFPKHAYFPFGLGPRRCLGENLAWMEGVLVAGTVLQQFLVDAEPGHQPVPDPGLILRPRGGLAMRCRRDELPITPCELSKDEYDINSSMLSRERRPPRAAAAVPPPDAR